MYALHVYRYGMYMCMACIYVWHMYALHVYRYGMYIGMACIYVWHVYLYGMCICMAWVCVPNVR